RVHTRAFFVPYNPTRASSVNILPRKIYCKKIVSENPDSAARATFDDCTAHHCRQCDDRAHERPTGVRRLFGGPARDENVGARDRAEHVVQTTFPTAISLCERRKSALGASVSEIRHGVAFRTRRSASARMRGMGLGSRPARTRSRSVQFWSHR